ncbi:aldehyde dehydrogenase family protein [Pararhodobacter aggregans]|uniref:Aldehyde dehydrogenase n=1 Tax=Pararhodobacter aggregans TaxID=404875 RepID=A0A2T7ULZ2_9RHOB|nr:aldehyde dehydrogenase family protein [Pararhodobacter aggregans]PTW99964.1 acyl-CoA reductase-like NAD-dependent aldehyde dehydrogenase [Pararhodobacter aggregans]PVE45720.1 aldehyde dehydrogenase [Pararhodobacter aggregans]
MSDIPTLRNYVAGQWLGEAAPFEVRDPGQRATILAHVVPADAALVDQAVSAAARAQKLWARVPVAERAAAVLAAADRIEAEADKGLDGLVRDVVLETGMLPAEITLEFRGAAFAARDNVEAAQVALEPQVLEDETSIVRIERRPIGVVAAIVPWNAPIVLMIRKFAPALVAGCALVVKTPPTAPIGITRLLAGLAELFPAGVINVVHGFGEAGAALSAHPLVRLVSFTGGGVAARAIMATAADTMKNVQFELGGNDAAIVLDDFDIEKQIPMLMAGAFHRSGQFCFAIKRLYVPDAIYDRVFDAMAAYLDAQKIGHPLDPATTFGPINNKGQFDFLQGLIARSRAAGAELIELGTPVDPARWDAGNYMKPVLVRDAAPGLEAVTCEQFGPVLPVLRYHDLDAVVAQANGTEYGLGSSIWTSDEGRGKALARRLDAGMTFINKNAQSRLGRRHMPFGGIKQSGIGSENAEYGLHEFTEIHAINIHKA